MNQDLMLGIMKAMAWERAKGELNSLLHCYVGDMETFTKAETEINMFIKEFEDMYIS